MRKYLLVSGVLSVAAIATVAFAGFAKYPAKECDGCKPGEYYQRVEDTVPHGKYVYSEDPPCADSSVFIDRIQGAFSQKAGSGDARVDAATGAAGAVARALNVGGDLGKIIHEHTGSGDSSMCRLVCGVVPEGATISAYRLHLSNKEGDMVRCEPGTKCAGWARVFHPERRGRMACVVVSNWSHNLERRVWLDYWYKNPSVEPVEYR